MTARILAGAALGLALSGAALSSSAVAQSYNAPAGIPAATAPGGLSGQAAARNIDEYADRFSRSVSSRAGVDGVYTTGSVRGPAAQRSRSID